MGFDTNVIENILKDKVPIAKDDPIICECNAVLSKLSKVEKIPNSKKSVWVCEFCGKKNEVSVEKEEIPQTDCTDYTDYRMYSTNQTKIIEQTGREIIRIKPNDIPKELINNELVATNVKVNVKIHKLMEFRKEDKKDIKNEGCTLIKEVGNVRKKSELSIEYCFKKSEEIGDINLDSLKFVLFQSIIDCTNNSGDRFIRVVTKTHSTNDALQLQKTSKLAKDEKYREIQENDDAWNKYIGKEAIDNVNAPPKCSPFYSQQP